jgi:periplasmic mercuric ion binding protein
MKLSKWLGFWSMALVLALAGAVRAETTVELKGVHLCCGACVAAVSKTLKTVDGVKGKCDQKAKTVTITAGDAESAQKAVDALVGAGFYGSTDSKDVKVKGDSGVKKETVKTLTLTGAHNCCGQCTKIIKETLKKVEGVTGDTVKSKADTFDVTGEFDAADLVKALETAGFAVKVKK